VDFLKVLLITENIMSCLSLFLCDFLVIQHFQLGELKDHEKSVIRQITHNVVKTNETL